MTRLDRLLLHMPRLRRLVLDREAFAAHCTRLQRELDENLERERTLCQELETSAKDARALTAHGTRLQGELDGILERERTLRQELETSAEEARALTGLPMDTPAEIAAAATEIHKLGAQNIVVSMGQAGALLRAREGTWLTHSPKIVEKNPIGAGDSMVGGLVWALTQGIALKEALGWGVASGAATASLNGTEVGSRPLIEKLFSQVHYEFLETA